MPSQLLIAKQLHTNMYNAVGHGIRLMAFHQRFHDECIMLNKCFRKSDLSTMQREKQKHFKGVVALRIYLFSKPDEYEGHNCYPRF